MGISPVRTYVNPVRGQLDKENGFFLSIIASETSVSYVTFRYYPVLSQVTNSPHPR